jgi:hypothetical protein
VSVSFPTPPRIDPALGGIITAAVKLMGFRVYIAVF